MRRSVRFVFEDGQTASIWAEGSVGEKIVRAHFDGAVERLASLFLFADLNVYIELAVFDSSRGWENLARKLRCDVTVT